MGVASVNAFAAYDNFFGIFFQYVMGIVCAVGECYAAARFFGVIDVCSVVEAIIEQQYPAGRHRHRQGAQIERLAFEFASGVALLAMEGPLMAPGYDADAAIFDGRFLQVDQRCEKHWIVNVLAGVPGHDARFGRADHQVVVLVAEQLDIGTEEIF